ncbi:tRNA-splicing ligase RtcB [Natronorubrum daqingense]|uniref:tRNA-splicing ligase RtcB n=1 Tax=Natronorubrum daqingense TaxID=588898 RepID=A0A1N7EBN6_9EURY|nr:RtcB family protein [Natronorubrum daqingense]SIR85419.1 tRNA-splicing ligase RtcB [Natronorubrum daqingense]
MSNATFDADGITLEQVREYVWEVPQTGDMRTPARILASEALLEEITEDKTLEQISNTTHLPGITNHAICMPDGHQGYGFPVGGVGALDAENGCISPGAVGYDINCLSGESDVLLEHGRRIPIEDLEDRFETETAMVASDELTTSPIQLFTGRDDAEVYEVETETGDTITATPDHPFQTPAGMRPLEELSEGDEVRLQPFRGVPDEEPEEFTVLSEADFSDANSQLVRALDDRGLLPLKSTDDAFNRLLKLVGFHTGDGAIGSGGQTWFYGEPADLESIQDDIEAIGFTPSKIYERDRSHEIDGKRFETTEYSVRANSKAFQNVLLALGAPDGRKIESNFTTPWFFDRLPNWQKALYAAAYFGAEMNAPAAQHDKNLYCPKVSQTRVVDVADAGEEFMADLAAFLSDLGIETNEIERFETDSSADRETIRLRLGIKNDSENLIRFFSSVGFRYNHEKRRKAVKALQYLKTKAAVIDHRATIAREAKAMADGGTPAGDIKSEFDINERFIERSIWGGRSGRPRPPAEFPGFDEYCETISVGDDYAVSTRIRSIELVDEEHSVYDIGVAHDAHNFIADGFVVSNCGVRMMRTNLTYDDLKGREEELVDSLFANIPSGLGGGGVVEAGVDTVDEILARGVDWALENGHAVEDDLRHCEDEGMREGADPSKVSQKAKDRGKNQIGSLGSGNHFLEVQRVTDVFDDEVGDAFGLEEDQIVVLIHCGSRGLGHQTCNDYLRKIEKQHQGLLNQLPDKELAAAPAGSQLAEDYYAAMNAAINFAWVNRQLIMHRTREVFERVFDRSWEAMEMDLLYDVAHNIAKKETHDVDGEDRELFVHRKGATRAFPAGHPEVPKAYRDVGQPVIIPGSMGAGSYVLRGGENSMDLTFGSTAHGAGRLMSRTQAKDEFWGGDVQDQLEEQDQIYVKAQSGATVAEEAPGVYKDVDEVVRISDELGIGDKVARTFPVCNIKG